MNDNVSSCHRSCRLSPIVANRALDELPGLTGISEYKREDLRLILASMCNDHSSIRRRFLRIESA